VLPVQGMTAAMAYVATRASNVMIDSSKSFSRPVAAQGSRRFAGCGLPSGIHKFACSEEADTGRCRGKTARTAAVVVRAMAVAVVARAMAVAIVARAMPPDWLRDIDPGSESDRFCDSPGMWVCRSLGPGGRFAWLKVGSPRNETVGFIYGCRRFATFNVIRPRGTNRSCLSESHLPS